MKAVLRFLLVFLLGATLPVYGQRAVPFSARGTVRDSAARDSAVAHSKACAMLVAKGLEARAECGPGEVYPNQVFRARKQEEAREFFKQAADCYRDAIVLDSTYPVAWNNLGTTYFFSDDFRGSLPYFLHAISLKPDFSEAWLNVGLVYEKLALNDSAKFALRKSIASDSAYVDGYDHLARMLMQEGKPDSALALLHTAARHRPNSEVLWKAMANIHFELKDSAAAISDLEEVARINPHNAQRLRDLSAYFGRHGNVAKQKYYNDLFEEERKKMQRR